MDTVTETKMAIALAEQGGIGIIHKNNTIQEQSAMVSAVKKYISGVVRNPVTISSYKKVSDLMDIIQRHHFTGMPVVDDGVLKGIVTSRDIRYAQDFSVSIASIMTKRERLITATGSTSLDDIKHLMYKHRLEKIILIDSNSQDTLRGLVTMKDIEKSIYFPFATKDKAGKLRVGAALGTSPDTEERAEALVEAGVDILVVDSAHGHSKGVLETIQYLRNRFSSVDIIGGNVSTPEAAIALQKAGVDAIKIGMGPGSICSTRIIAGIGVPQITALLTIYEKMKDSNIPLIADGGIRYSGDIAKAFAAGADTVMLGSMFAGTEESAGEIEIFNGRNFKVYRGMGSLGAMNKLGDRNRYFQDKIVSTKTVPEGVEGRVPYKGNISSVIQQLVGGVRQSLGYTGCKSIYEMKEKAEFVEITNAGMRESHVHDIQITKEAPNYVRDSFCP